MVHQIAASSLNVPLVTWWVEEGRVYISQWLDRLIYLLKDRGQATAQTFAKPKRGDLQVYGLLVAYYTLKFATYISISSRVEMG